MLKNNTLSDLSAYLKSKTHNNEIDIKSKEEFLKRSPETISETVTEEVKSSLDGISLEEIADYINEIAKERGTNFIEVWLEVLEFGSEEGSVFKGGGVVSTLMSAHKTSVNLIKNRVMDALSNKK